MMQYRLFLVLAPLAFIITLFGMLLPRFHHSCHRFMRLYSLQILQLCFLVVNTAELLASEPLIKRYLAAADYLVLGIGTSLFFLFCLEYIGFLRRFKAWEAAFFIMPILCFAAGVSPAHSLIWKELRFESLGQLTLARHAGYGILAKLMFAQGYFLTFLGAWTIGWFTMAGHSLYRRQTSWMLVGVAAPALVSIAYVARIVPGWEKDFSAIAISFASLCFAVASLRHRLFAVVPISRQAMMEQLRCGMLAVDSKGTIIDMNQTACRMLGRSEIGILGSPAGPLVALLESRYAVCRHPIANDGYGAPGYQLEIREKGIPATSTADSPVLSLGELRVVEMLSLNLSNKEIGARLGVSANTVKFHLGNAFRKTGAKNRAELVDRIASLRGVG